MSMVSSDLLYQVDKRLYELFKCEGDPFGNVGVCLVGDLMQLPPLGPQIFGKPFTKSFQNAHNVRPLWEIFDVIEFNTNHRQGEHEKRYAELLNRIRIDEHTEDDIDTLMTRIIENKKLKALDRFTNKDIFDACHVFYTNPEVEELNLEMLNMLTTELEQIPCIENKNPRWFKSTETKYGTVGSTQFFKNLKLKVGARVALNFNVCLSDDLFNGALGEVVGIEKKNGKVEAIMVKFDDPSIGENQRKIYHEYSSMAKYAQINATPIFRQDLTYHIKGHAAKAHVNQFPLRLAWASTAHKIQVSCLKYIKFQKKCDNNFQLLLGKHSSQRIKTYNSLA